MRWNLTAILLAAVHAAAGLVLLVFSSWFIAACAIASPGFNYMIPAVVIRALALLRIASGYAQMWLGHRELLDHLADIRSCLFQRLRDCRRPAQDASIEALAHHTEAQAAIWVAWIAQNAGAILMLMIGQLTLLWWVPQLAWYGWLLLLAYVVITAWTCLKSMSAIQHLQTQQQHFRNEADNQLAAVSLWHLQLQYKLADASATWLARNLAEQHTESGRSSLHLVSLSLLLMLLAQPDLPYQGQAVLLVPVMLLLSARDWLSAAIASQPALSGYLHSKKELQSLPVEPVKRIRGPSTLGHFGLRQFQIPGLPVPPIDLDLEPGKVLLLKGSSGSGKSSLLQAICGLLPASGKRLANHLPLQDGVVDNWHLALQHPLCLSATLAENLQIARPDASYSDMQQALRKGNLYHLVNALEEWMGQGGRQLSGGELKRLNLVRALLTNTLLWCMDEPFEGLDSHQQQLLAETINQAAKNRIILIASHVQPPNLRVTQIINLDDLVESAQSLLSVYPCLTAP
ncbi:ATP-binding cassette domain-containing protein [Bowmanella dokdonensis]|uniref:ATP-binding cassette domain-containing protein n=1 Tax=Bowmanella dokdonensis TaxID=751969 RepID=A0A939DLE7_9ALTE|nr:ATP-binding cassette domain-containing protein [Bowmanella dokdonensis]MBN7824797.1 ATP-binding cassette domain-containing protein [Bowmanella dokdonensis]